MKPLSKVKNIIFLSIDALSYELLESRGFGGRLMPNLYSIHKRSLSCKNAFSHGLPTQLAFPSIFSSTLPLDKDGYDLGIKNRERSFVESLQKSGFKTVGFGTCNALNEYSGYDRGFDQFINVFDIESFWKATTKVYLKHYKAMAKERGCDLDSINPSWKPLLLDRIQFMVDFCEKKLSEKAAIPKKRGLYLETYDYKSLQFSVKGFLWELRERKFDFETLEAIESKIDQLLHKAFLESDRMKQGFMKRIFHFLHQKLKKLSPRFSFVEFEPHINARDLTNLLLEQIASNRNKPLFLWTHVLDIHELSFKAKGLQWPPYFNLSFLHHDFFKKSFRRDLAIRKAAKFVDREIGRIVNFLAETEQLDSTLLIFCGDHGAARKKTPRKTHKARLFYEEYTHVPLFFFHPEITADQNESLCGLIDLAPTLLELVGISEEEGFRGKPVYSEEVKNRGFLIMENLGRGPCDFNHKQTNICIRTPKQKLIWREAINATSEVQNEFYDLEADPLERRNRIATPENSELIQMLESLARDRTQEIRRSQKKDSVLMESKP